VGGFAAVRAPLPAGGLRDKQRAEYLADALSARVAGSAAAASLQEKLLLEPIIRNLVQRAAREARRDGPGHLFADMRRVVLEAPARELERRRRVALLEHARLDATHPPTAKRIHVLEARAPLPGDVILGSETSAAIDRELEPLHAELAGRMVEEFRDSLYV
jgi:hypothetical protein